MGKQRCSENKRLEHQMEPVDPFQYNGSSGSVPRDTSVDREMADRESGATSLRAKRFMYLLEAAGENGLTWKEMGEAYKDRYAMALHHGQISGMLSNLHRDGSVFTTQHTKRDNSHAYFHCCIRYIFDDEVRHDHPVQTKAGIRKASLESLVAHIKLLNDHQEEFSYSEFTETLGIYLARFDKQTE